MLNSFEQCVAGLMGQGRPWQDQPMYWRHGYAPTSNPSSYYPPDYPPPAEGGHFTTMITDDLVDSPAEPPKTVEPPKEEPPSEFKELSNHAFHKLLQEFTDLTQLCVQSIL